MIPPPICSRTFPLCRSEMIRLTAIIRYAYPPPPAPPIHRLSCHYIRYLTYNILEQRLPRKGEGRSRRARSAFIGAAASIVSAAASNAFRVLKVYRYVYLCVCRSDPQHVQHPVHVDGLRLPVPVRCLHRSHVHLRRTVEDGVACISLGIVAVRLLPA